MDDNLPEVDPAYLHQKFMDTIARQYNAATPEQARKMDAMLATTKAKAVSSVGGLRSLFPGLGRLQLTKAALKEELG